MLELVPSNESSLTSFFTASFTAGMTDADSLTVATVNEHRYLLHAFHANTFFLSDFLVDSRFAIPVYSLCHHSKEVIPAEI